jgi:predicted membrane-bound dolichyl-phosphate-mannose-protein mannosyltransferase
LLLLLAFADIACELLAADYGRLAAAAAGLAAGRKGSSTLVFAIKTVGGIGRRKEEERKVSLVE